MCHRGVRHSCTPRKLYKNRDSLFLRFQILFERSGLVVGFVTGAVDQSKSPMGRNFQQLPNQIRFAVEFGEVGADETVPLFRVVAKLLA